MRVAKLVNFFPVFLTKSNYSLEQQAQLETEFAADAEEEEEMEMPLPKRRKRSVMTVNSDDEDPLPNAGAVDDASDVEDVTLDDGKYKLITTLPCSNKCPTDASSQHENNGGVGSDVDDLDEDDDEDAHESTKNIGNGVRVF